ncbi:MAG: hypothetical protein AB1695_12545 [Stygiobacter sp.]
MKVITERDIIKNIRKMWRKQYSANDISLTPQLKKIYEKLKKLDLNKATAKEINKIIGNESWTNVVCNECYNYVNLAVEFGDDSESFIVCTDCLAEVWKEIENKIIKQKEK